MLVHKIEARGATRSQSCTSDVLVSSLYKCVYDKLIKWYSDSWNLLVNSTLFTQLLSHQNLYPK